ncbi:hypothetical protein mRhiFer1_009592 [Rhinolophus ferrumequinum]|uniref:Uncharacterized protein n=1 Tax=Rhinolophus ferrumequinum TaxID=59479 RepID=A0A7J7ZRS0_RHIFE|nr:hypothetical protein mRhiFer1_009592 [Rhinolophus ferrumequinum]
MENREENGEQRRRPAGGAQEQFQGHRPPAFLPHRTASQRRGGLSEVLPAVLLPGHPLRGRLARPPHNPSTRGRRRGRGQRRGSPRSPRSRRPHPRPATEHHPRLSSVEAGASPHLRSPTNAGFGAKPGAKSVCGEQLVLGDPQPMENGRRQPKKRGQSSVSAHPNCPQPPLSCWRQRKSFHGTLRVIREAVDQPLPIPVPSSPCTYQRHCEQIFLPS